MAESTKGSRGIFRTSENGDDVGRSAKEIQPQEASSSSMSIDGTRPLAAYRRLLAIMFHVRNVRHESGPGYELPTGTGAHVVQKTEAEFRAFEAVFFDLKIDSRFRIYERIRERLAAVRVQRAWRRKLSRSCEVPLAMLELFRPGFLRGSGETISRVVHHPPHWVQQQVAEVYTAKLRSERHLTPPLAWIPTVVLRGVCRWITSVFTHRNHDSLAHVNHKASTSVYSGQVLS